MDPFEVFYKSALEILESEDYKELVRRAPFDREAARRVSQVAVIVDEIAENHPDAEKGARLLAYHQEILEEVA